MKAIIEFDFNNPDDIEAHKRAIKSLDMALVLFEIRFNLKKSSIHKLESMLPGVASNEPPDFYTALDIVFDKINDMIEESSINIDELIS